MFDKNVFKEKFRVWSEQLPFANAEEIEKFCNLHIPEEFRIQYSWLKDESTQWFLWRQESMQKELQQELTGIAFKN